MREVILDFTDVTDRESLHDVLQEGFEFPAYYGRNLDALWDLLMEIQEPVTMKVMGAECLQEATNPYGDKLLITLKQAATENCRIQLQGLAD